MICINSQYTDPYFNLASEEYFLKHHDAEVFMLWVSQPAVIVGKHQNTLSEINYGYITSSNILVARRLTGGGTVYHDTGNLNFTWIMKGEAGRLVDFKKFVNPVIGYLKSLGIDAVCGGRNDILVQDKKISGNAEHVYKKRVLHHGTLLFNANLQHLRGSLKTVKGRYADKAVKSVPHPVVNLRDYLPASLTFDEFRDGLFSTILQSGPENHEFIPGPKDMEETKKLQDEKYNTWDWIYGYSPAYKMQTKIKAGKFSFDICLNVSKGTITDVSINDLQHAELKGVLISNLMHTRHEEKEILEKLIKAGILNQFKDFKAGDFVKALF